MSHLQKGDSRKVVWESYKYGDFFAVMVDQCYP